MHENVLFKAGVVLSNLTDTMLCEEGEICCTLLGITTKVDSQTNADLPLNVTFLQSEGYHV